VELNVINMRMTLNSALWATNDRVWHFAWFVTVRRSCRPMVPCKLTFSETGWNRGNRLACDIGTASRLCCSSSHNRHINIAVSMVPFVQSIHILGVTLDSFLTVNKHVTKTAAICNTFIRSLRHVLKTELKTDLFSLYD